jgi:hypothetical protein
LTAARAKYLVDLLEGTQPTNTDIALYLSRALAPIQPPHLKTAWVQKLFPALRPLDMDIRDLEFTLPQSAKVLLPSSWRELSAKDLAARIRRFPIDESPEAIGDKMRLQLLTMFQELDRRADQKGVGRRRTFRTLFVPEEVTVEFEQVLGDEERLRTKPKIGTPKVRRGQESNDYAYEFKKVERPMRFRVLAGDTSTSWLQIQVKPIPTLKQLSRRHDELGYLHGSNSRVQSGPFPVSLEGNESRFDVPAGTRLALDGECYKDLKQVRAMADLAASSAKSPPSVAVKHEAETKSFHVDIGELAGGELRLRLELDDTDGIQGRRELVITVVGDKPPEFQNLRFDVVNHKMITPQAVLPFSGLIHDDHGLMDLWFEAMVEKDQKVITQKRIPLLHFLPLAAAEPAPPGGRFEKWEDISLARLLAGPRGENVTAQLGLVKLPAAGPASWLPVFFGDIPRNYRFQYRERAGGGPVLGADDEYLDTMLLRPQVPEGAKPPPWIAPPYLVRVSIGARDNRIVSDSTGRPQSAGQESFNAETFEFTVVNEADLLIEAGKREEDLRDRCEEIIVNLKKARTALQRLRDEFPTLNDTNEFRRAIADGQDLSKALRTARDGVDQKVLREFRQIYRELTLNRCRADVRDRIDQKICRPLELILQPGQQFERADEALDALLKAMEMDKANTSKALFNVSVEQMDRLIGRLDDILIEMKKLIEFNQALNILRDLIKAEEDIVEKIKKERKRIEDAELNDKKP